MSEFEDKLGAILNNPDAMGQIANLAKSFGSGGGAAVAAETPEAPDCSAEAPPAGGDLFAALGNLDPRIIQTAMKLFTEYSTGDEKKVALLSALRPFVKEERYAKVDRAIQVAKLSRMIRLGLELFKKEETDDV
ncbi:MAG: hypothetical protein RR502_09050 [Oscillospiraceae bacterium]